MEVLLEKLIEGFSEGAAIFALKLLRKKPVAERTKRIVSIVLLMLGILAFLGLFFGIMLPAGSKGGSTLGVILICFGAVYIAACVILWAMSRRRN